METTLRSALITWLASDPQLAASLNTITEEAPTRTSPPWLGIAASASADWADQIITRLRIIQGVRTSVQGAKAHPIAGRASRRRRTKSSASTRRKNTAGTGEVRRVDPMTKPRA